MGESSSAPPLVTNPDLSKNCTMGSVLGLITVIILVKLREIVFFQTNKFTAYKVRRRKEVAKYLMVLNLYMFIHPFKSKTYLRS